MSSFVVTRQLLRVWIVGVVSAAALLLSAILLAAPASATEQVPCGSGGEVTLSTPFAGDGAICFGPGGSPGSVVPISAGVDGIIPGNNSGFLLNLANERIPFSAGETITFPGPIDVTGVSVNAIA